MHALRLAEKRIEQHSARVGVDLDEPRAATLPQRWSWTWLRPFELIQINGTGQPRSNLALDMSRYRHRRLRTRISILAITALFWSQFLLAGHGVCSLTTMSLSEHLSDVASSIEASCHKPTLSSEAILCKAHCSETVQSDKVGHVPPVLALAPSPAVAMAAIAVLQADRAPNCELPPPVSWHRPTLHPASLLLI